jgi:cysteine synthase
MRIGNPFIAAATMATAGLDMISSTAHSNPPTSTTPILNSSPPLDLGVVDQNHKLKQDSDNNLDLQQFLPKVPRFGDLNGHSMTPIVDLSHLCKDKRHPDTKILAKCEFMNPSLSIKDRIARHMIETSLEDGSLTLEHTIVAASSGNTGAAVAMVAAQYGLKCIIITCPKCSIEKKDAIRAYGATLLVSPSEAGTEEHPDHYMNLETRIAAMDPNKYFGVNQYDNPLNSQAYYKTLGPEIWQQTQSQVTHFVAGGSTGGTVSGTGQFLKEQNPDVHITLADPVGSVLAQAFARHVRGVDCEVQDCSELVYKKFHLEGVGKDSVPGTMDFDFVDTAVTVSDEESFDTCHLLSGSEGMLVGGSSGMNVKAAFQLARTVTGPAGSDAPACIVTVLPDSGIKYLSKVYSPQWLSSQGMSMKGKQVHTVNANANGADSKRTPPAAPTAGDIAGVPKEFQKWIIQD